MRSTYTNLQTGPTIGGHARPDSLKSPLYFRYSTGPIDIVEVKAVDAIFHHCHRLGAAVAEVKRRDKRSICPKGQAPQGA